MIANEPVDHLFLIVHLNVALAGDFFFVRYILQKNLKHWRSVKKSIQIEEKRREKLLVNNRLKVQHTFNRRLNFQISHYNHIANCSL